MRNHYVLTTLVTTAALALGLAACGGDEKTTSAGGSQAEAGVKGKISIDGSSTVYPFAQAAAELFNEGRSRLPRPSSSGRSSLA